MLTDLFPLIEDIKDDYLKARRHGSSRQEGIELVLSIYSSELSDIDDAPQVWLGLAIALASKKEMTPDILAKAKTGAETLMSLFPESQKTLSVLVNTSLLNSNIGSEAKYPVKRIYKPSWKVGDTFIHRLTGGIARENGIEGWYAIVRKIGEEFDDNTEVWFQNVFISICSEESIPKSSSELENLGYLPIKKNRIDPAGEPYYYMGQLWISSKQVESRFQLEYIGCFPDVIPPKMRKKPHDLYGGSLILYPQKEHDYLTELVCWAYGRYGIVK